MRHEKYKVRISNSFLDYEFYSVGPKGRILKRVAYEKMWGSASDYNLSFGDVDGDDQIDDFAVTDNKDSKKVLVTVAFTVASFLQVYPDKRVYINGSTDARTRLYRIGISNNLQEFEGGFEIYGLDTKWNRFKKNVNYKRFMVTRKHNLK